MTARDMGKKGNLIRLFPFFSTCDLISSTYGLTNTTLYLNNPQINNDCSNIYVGEVLCVDTTIYPYSSSSAYYNNADATGSATFDYGGSGTTTGSAQGAAATVSFWTTRPPGWGEERE
jgi:hypothetical protein